MGTRYFHCTLQCHKNVFRPSKRPWSQSYSWQKLPNPLFYEDLLLYRLPHFFKFCPTHLSLLPYFFGWMGDPAHLLSYFLFNDIMDLQVPSLDTLVPEGPCCVFFGNKPSSLQRSDTRMVHDFLL